MVKNELHDEEDSRHRSVCYVANRWRDRCAGPIQQGPDAGYRHGGEPPKDPVRRLPTFIQTPTARSTCIGSPAPRCALGAAPGGQHAATRSEAPPPSTNLPSPASPEQTAAIFWPDAAADLADYVLFADGKERFWTYGYDSIVHAAFTGADSGDPRGMHGRPGAGRLSGVSSQAKTPLASSDLC